MQFNNITFYTGIKDKDIEVLEEKYEIRDNKKVALLYVRKKKQKQTCPRCNSEVNRVHDYRDQEIKHIKICEYQTCIIYRKRRYRCSNCNLRFFESNDFVQRYRRLSNNLILKVLIDLKRKISFKDVAEMHNISISTVLKIFVKHIDIEKPSKLSEVLCFDEFKSTTTAGNYSFILADPNEGKILDILHDRQRTNIEAYFSQYPKDERKQVKIVIMDMWQPYKYIVKRMFPNALIVADTFHFTRHIHWAINKVRVRIQNENKRNKEQYKLLKRNWRLICAHGHKLTYKTFYSRKYRRVISNMELLDMCLQTSEELNEAYNLKEDFYTIINNATYETINNELETWFKRVLESGISEFIEEMKPIVNWKDEVINSFIINGKTNKKYSNGYLEGLNNKIKVIKRISFGYKNFHLFRNRIMYIHS